MSAPTILVIPGIGDLHWVALKLQGFLEARGLATPKVYVWNFDERPRSLDFVKRLPFVIAGDYFTEPRNEKTEPVLRAAYMTGEVDCVEGFEGFDYFLCVNGKLRRGDSLASTLGGCAINYDYPMLMSSYERTYGQDERRRGPYVLLYFSDQGMFKNWLRHWGPDEIREFVRALQRQLPAHRLVLTGASWDKRFIAQLQDLELVDLVGRTTIEEMLGLIRYADGFAGWCGGNTIIATHLGIPTVMMWSDYFLSAKQTSWCDPKKLGGVYIPKNVERTSPHEAAAIMANMVTSSRRLVA